MLQVPERMVERAQTDVVTTQGCEGIDKLPTLTHPLLCRRWQVAHIMLYNGSHVELVPREWGSVRNFGG